MHKILASTGALIGRANGRDYRILKDIIPRIDADGFEMMFELMFYEDWYRCSSELIGFLRSLPAEFPVLHVDKKIGEHLASEDFDTAYSRFEINCRVAREIGAKLLVLHLWNGIISDLNLNANFSGYARLRDIAEKYGLLLTVENVLCHNGTPVAHLLELLEIYPDAAITYDTKMADFDNENVTIFSPERIGIWKNVRHVHLNDRAGGYRDWNCIKTLHPGEGQVDFEAFFEGLRKVGYAGDFTLEATCLKPDGSVDVEKMNVSLGWLRKRVEGLG